MINSNAFHSIVNLLKRVTPKSSTLLDRVLSNDTSSEIIPGILRWDISDHFPTLVHIKNLKKKKSNQASFYRSRANFDARKFLSHLQNDLQMIKSDSQVLSHINFNAAFECFLQIFKNIVNLHAPVKKRSRKQRRLHQKPWITKAIFISIKHKQKLYVSHFINGDNIFKQFYKRYANTLTRIKERTKTMYYHDSLSFNTNNTYATWEVIKEILAKSTKTYSTTLLLL